LGETVGARDERTTDPDLVRFRQELEIQKRSPYTIKHYVLVVRQFHRWVNAQRGRAVPLRAVTAADLKQYQIHLTTQRQYAKNSLYHAVKGLQSFYRFIDSTSADDLRPPRRSQSLPKYLTEAEASRLRRTAADPRDRAFVSLLLYSGLRVGELCRLTLEAVDFADRTLRVRSGKGDKDRLVIVTDTCLEDLKGWLDVRPASGQDFVFPGMRGRRNVAERTVQRAVLRLAKEAGLEKVVTPHVLRHTLATSLLRHGGDIRFIQRILGHASIATTQVYTHLDDAELRRMYERAKPDF
jgi:integrase/recombinase XerD